MLGLEHHMQCFRMMLNLQLICRAELASTALSDCDQQAAPKQFTSECTGQGCEAKQSMAGQHRLLQTQGN